MEGVEFEWHDNMAAANAAHHDGVTFVQAIFAWRDPYAVEYPDRHEDEE